MSALACYKFVFITELLSAELMVSFRKTKRKYFVFRLIGFISLIYLLVFLFPLPERIAYSGWYSSLMFLTFFMLTMLFLKGIYVISWNNLLFIVIVAYTIKHFTYIIFTLIGVITNLYSIINMYSASPIVIADLDFSIVFYLMVYLFTYIFFYTVLYFIIGEKINRQDDIKLKRAHLLFVSAFAVLVDIVLNSFVVYEGAEKLGASVINCCFNILCCLLVFYVQLNLLEIKEVNSEKQIISQMLHQAQKQYELHKENIDLLNIKCHDIKHRISCLSGKNIDQSELDSINETVSVYDTFIETGNEVLDIILTEKSLVCKNNGILLTCMADAKNLSFIKAGDLYALFGNLTDNAIEAVLKIEAEDKRYIGVNVHSVEGFITITVKNYFSGTVEFSKDGLPVTTKKDTNFHGFGMKSIKMIVDKYNGNLSIVVENNIFKINILFPLP